MRRATRPASGERRCGTDPTRLTGDRTFVFIGGLHRSGTTLLTRCLADHPNASGFSETGAPEDEGQHLQSVYPTAERFGGPGRFGLATEMHMTERSALVTDDNRQRLLDGWAEHWQCDRPVLIEKSPPNLIKGRFLQAMFPTAHFVMVLRHPVAACLATRKWTSAGVDELIEHWLISNETMLADARHLRRVTFVRYEDFTADSDREVARLQAFVGLEEHPCTLSPRPALNERYFAEWRRAARWLARRRLLVRRFEQRVSTFGYSLRNLESLASRETVAADTGLL